MSNTTITILIPIEIKDKAAEKAKEQGYTLAHYVRDAVNEKNKRSLK